MNDILFSRGFLIKQLFQRVTKNLRIFLEIPVVRLFFPPYNSMVRNFLIHIEQSELDPLTIKESNVQEFHKIIKILPNLFDKSYYPSHNIAR
jgi:hypothetical protein